MTDDMQWDAEELFLSGDAFFERVFSEVRGVRRSIDVEVYIFNGDEVGRMAEDALIGAAARGARARLLVDGIGSRAWIASSGARLRATGVDVRVYHPLWPFSRLVNRRNHRKTWILDGRAAFVGSMNVAAVHSERVSGGSAWQDAAVRVEGPEISALQAAFEQAWSRGRAPDGQRVDRTLNQRKWIDRLRGRGPKPALLVRLNYTQSLRRRSFHDFLARLTGARRSVWIANPYLVPSPIVLRALARARKAGADVKILVPQSSDVFFMRWVATAFYGPLVRAGAEVYEYLPRFLHQKSTVVDDWATVGTSNMNTRSLLHDLEVDVVLSHRESVRELATAFEALLKDAVRVDPGRQTWRARLAGVLGRAVTFFFRHWI